MKDELVQVILLLPVLLVPRVNGILCVSREPQSQTLENVQSTVRQACHHVGAIWEGAATAQRGKNTHVYYHSFIRSVKLQRECPARSPGRHQESTLAPCHCARQPVSSLNCL